MVGEIETINQQCNKKIIIEIESNFINNLVYRQ